MVESLDEFSAEFIEHAASTKYPALDIGCAFGIATIPALLKGSTIIANDLYEGHLNVLKENVPEKFRKGLTLLAGNFLTLFHGVDWENHFNSILVSRVLHFFKGCDIKKSFSLFFKILKNGGKIFVVNETPYLKNIEKFHPVYEERLKENNPWPGEIEDFKSFDSRKGTNLPDFMHLLDIPILERVAKETGFIIERSSYIKRDNFPKDIMFDGKESVGIILQKPFDS